MFDITTLAATDTSTVELVGGDDAPLFDDKGKPVKDKKTGLPKKLEDPEWLLLMPRFPLRLQNLRFRWLVQY